MAEMKPLLENVWLKTFVAVADCGNFTEAAEAVGLTQSAVSMQIKRLEEAVNASLFERTSRGAKLTTAGERLLPNARRILNMLAETVEMLGTRALKGSVRIGIPEEYGYAVLTGALGTFAKLHPGVDVTVRYAPSSEQLGAIRSGKLDLAIVFEWENYSEAEVLMSDPTVWVTSDLHGTHEETPLPIAVYENSAWCRDFAIRSLEPRNIAYRIAYTSQTSGGLKLAVASGLAIAPLSRSNIPLGCRELNVADGFSDIDASRVVLHRNRKTSGAAIEGMVSALREAFRARSPFG
jgi:DNA-binding transcriptional LysR family regulator